MPRRSVARKGKSDNVPVRELARLRLCQHLLGKLPPTGTLIEHFGPSLLRGWFDDDDGHREQCDFRFRFKTARSVMPKTILPPDAAGNDAILVDPTIC